MLVTRTGGFPIGFRRMGSEWQKDLDGLVRWAKAAGFGAIDLGGDADAVAAKVTSAGLAVGSADLLDWRRLVSGDRSAREAAVARNSAYVEACARAGVREFFIVMLPEKPELPRRENFGYMVESLNALAPALERVGARMVIEGWPGPGALCCTPETLRATFKSCPSRAIGINYDPSHLVRMGIDHVRFVEEFGDRIYHVHGKDAELLDENLYEFGLEQPPTFARPVGFGGMTWRYTIPGHGQVRWTRVFSLLKEKHYKGSVSVELEDANFNGSEQGEKEGLLAGAQFLASA